jgi:hypothetical protein
VKNCIFKPKSIITLQVFVISVSLLVFLNVFIGGIIGNTKICTCLACTV